MTLIIAGHNLEKSWDVWYQEDDSKATSKIPAKMEANGLFIASDSVITNSGSSGSIPILGGFRKVYPIQIKVWKPYFIEEYFNGYKSVHYESECFVAFAGSTLTAQHVLNSISTHLRNIRISIEKNVSSATPWKYKIIRHCQKNILEDKQHAAWDEDMFTPNDYFDIVTGEGISDIIEYSINDALSSARKYKLDEAAFNSMYTEFAVGIYCPTTRSHKLYTFRFSYKINDGILNVYAKKYEVPESEIAVLGMRKEFEVRANKIFKDSIASATPPAKELFTFLNDAINEIHEKGSYEIDRPSVLRTFYEGKLIQVEFCK